MRKGYIRYIIFITIVFIGAAIIVKNQMIEMEKEKVQEQIILMQQKQLAEMQNENNSENIQTTMQEQNNNPLNPQTPNDTDTKIEVYLKMALEYENMEDYNNAVKMYEKCYELEKDFNTFEKILDIYMKLGNKTILQEKLNSYTPKNPSEVERLNKFREYLN